MFYVCIYIYTHYINRNKHMSILLSHACSSCSSVCMHENTCTFNSSYASKLLIQWEHFSVGASLPGATISKARESLDTAGPRTRSVIKSSDMATSGPGSMAPGMTGI